MSIDLTQPLQWTSATGDAETMLENLQPNIVKPHVRDDLTVLFLHFDVAAEARTFLQGVRTHMKSAKDHLLEIQAFKASHDPSASATYVGVGLTASGYSALSVAATPADAKFSQPGGMKGSRGALDDPAISLWEPTYRGDIHAVVLVGDAATNEGRYVGVRNAILDLLTEGITVLGEETGRSLVNADGHGIEHFGYVDGRSQPLFLAEDVTDETNTTDGTNAWNPAFPLGQLVVADPAAPDPSVHFGSYLVFRKLEQNVALFKEAEDDLADRLGLVGEDTERAGAMIIGRFEDGTPLTIQSEAGAHEPLMNNFSYDSDAEGSKCPFHAHIRKSNPRGSGGAPGGGPANLAFERSHIMARRGQTYGHRSDDPNGDLPPSARPTGDVGLLFMAFNADLGNQFEFTQAAWVNNPNFPFTSPTPAGLDPVIGQGPRPQTDFPKAWGDPARMTTDQAAQAVTLKGGQYFFMPSLAFLDTL
ncbi:MAG: peroxidase [bacterium]